MKFIQVDENGNICAIVDSSGTPNHSRQIKVDDDFDREKASFDKSTGKLVLANKKQPPDLIDGKIVHASSSDDI